MNGINIGVFGNYSIIRRLVHEAYAKNGNAHNPTKEYSYTLYRNGLPASSPFRRLKDAKKTAAEWSQEVRDDSLYPTKG